MKYFVSIYCLLYCTILTAQKSNDPQYKYPYGFDCESGFYQLINNQLNLLSVNHKGLLEWFPVLPPFEHKVGAISYCLEDGFMYGFDTETFELLRIYQSGTIESLGVPKHSITKAPLNAKLTVGELAGSLFCAYAPEKNCIYWIDIHQNTFTISPTITEGVMTNLAYHPIQQVFYTIGNNGSVYAIDPHNRAADEVVSIMGLPMDPVGILGNLWITKDARLFATRQNGVMFHEINEKMGVLYNYTLALPQTIGDGTSCSNAPIPVMLEEELLEWKADLPAKGRIMLRWVGVHEKPNCKYIVEESTNHVFWTEKDFKSASPTPVINQNPYGSLIPYNEHEGHYYRLKKEYSYGKTVYSRTILANWDTTQKKMLLSPEIVNEHQSLSLYISGYNNAVLDIRIQNQYGKLAKIKQQQILSAEITLSLDVDELNSGMYYVVINTPNGVERLRFYKI